MHIFNMSVTDLQSVEKIQWKLEEELISQSMYYLSLFTMRGCRKIATLKTLSVCQKFFLASIFIMHIFNMSETYLQSVEKMQWKL